MHPRRDNFLYWFVLVAAALNFGLAYVRLLYAPFFFDRYAHGSAPYPYQTRILMARVFALFEHNRLLAFLSAHARMPLNLPFRFLLLFVAFLSIVAAVYFVRLALEFLTRDANWARWASFLVLFMAYFHYILDSDSPYMYPYDLPSLAVFSIGIYLLLRRRWFWYYLVFILGTFNRETTCFLTLFMIAFEASPVRLPRTTSPRQPIGAQPAPTRNRRYTMIGLHVLAQAVLWIAIRDYSGHYYSRSPQYFYFALPYNLTAGFLPQHLPTLASAFGFLWIVYLLGFKAIPFKSLRLGAWVLGLWLAVMFCFGWIYELRIYGELIPYMAICVTLILREWLLDWRGPAPASPLAATEIPS